MHEMAQAARRRKGRPVSTVGEKGSAGWLLLSSVPRMSARVPMAAVQVRVTCSCQIRQ